MDKVAECVSTNPSEYLWDANKKMGRFENTEFQLWT